MKIPNATYRIQFNPDFTFADAQNIIEYLDSLGISHLYASPIFKAKKGSTHGYDIVDSNEINPELGGMKEFEKLVRSLQKKGMYWLQDIVPNHMAFDPENRMLMDVLENGSYSDYFNFFDIEWDHFYKSMKGKLLAPFLGRFYGESLEGREIQLKYKKDGLSINYYNLRFPANIESYLKVLSHDIDSLKTNIAESHPDYMSFTGIIYILRDISSKPLKAGERHEKINFIKNMLWTLYNKNQKIKEFIDRNVKTFNGRRGRPSNFDLLDDLLSDQQFRLSFWKVATEEINYVRFFNINELITLRMQDENVFRHLHKLIFGLVSSGKFSGLRIDHVDGLYDPYNYLKRLKEQVGDTYIAVEKILSLKEELPDNWPIEGTTGYDFLNCINGIFCEEKNKRKFNKIYSDFTGITTSYEELVAEKKRLIIYKHMAGNIVNLAHILKNISSRDRHGKDITSYGLRQALIELMSFFPVYRTYINEEMISEQDRYYIKEAVKKATNKNPDLVYELNFIENFLLHGYKVSLTKEEEQRIFVFIKRFQQLTTPLMAKGFEDTVFYIYNRLLSLNEVGGNPNKFGTSVKELHNFNKKRQIKRTHSLNTLSTHDTKRGEDVRARINVLSEIPKEWHKNIIQWRRLNKKKKKKVNDINVPDKNDEYFLYQTLIGSFPFNENEYPLYIKRIEDYVVKAVREAKVYTAWLKPDTEYENAYISFVEEILTPSEKNIFLKELIGFQKKIAHYGAFNSLSQTLIKITSPGIPDFYQGSELWDLNLVDPDNRRPVDFNEINEILQNIKKRESNVMTLIDDLLADKSDGRLKLFLIYRALQARRNYPYIFEKGDYIPIKSEGKYKKQIVSFARRHEKIWALTAVPRFLTNVINEEQIPLGTDIWGDTYLKIPRKFPEKWEDTITGKTIKSDGRLLISDVLNKFPAALLISKS